MSDSSSLSDTGPSEAQLERALRETVKKIFVGDNLENLTVKRVRAAVEHDLDLREGYFKEARWKDRSKRVIEEEAQRHDEAASRATESLTSPKPTTARSTTKSPTTVRAPPVKKRRIAESIEQDEDDVVRPAKRNAKSKVISDDEEDLAQVSKEQPKSEKSQGTRKPVTAKTKSKAIVSERGSSVNDVTTPRQGISSTTKPEEELGDSDLSVLEDDMPKPKRKKKKLSSDNAKPKSKSEGKKTSKDADPQAEEIKSLQGWLAKCGIRKVWGKELKPYDTPREKIKHLKDMLADVGMTGRYSKEKAASIREARELAADLEAVQEGAKLWGKEGEESGRVERKRLTRAPLPTFDFMEDDSEG